ncbi:MAG: outer membrane beta-barrel protein [Shewanella sp.]
MKYLKSWWLLSVLGGMCIAPLRAETAWIIAPYGGYSLGGGQFDLHQLEDESLAAPSLRDEVSIDESGHYGLMLGFTTAEPGNIYLLFSRQSSDLTSGGMFSPELITPLTVDYIHLGGTLYFPRGDVLPYVTASVGATRMQPDHWSSETRFSMGIGGGVEYRLTRNLGLMADVRGFASFMDNDTALFCNENECLWRVTADVMWQVQANLGLTLRF